MQDQIFVLLLQNLFQLDQDEHQPFHNQLITMADGDSEKVFGKGHPVPQPETMGGVDLFARSKADETTDPGEAINEKPLLGSTPVMMHFQDAGDNGQAQENPETEIRTFHLS